MANPPIPVCTTITATLTVGNDASGPRRLMVAHALGHAATSRVDRGSRAECRETASSLMVRRPTASAIMAPHSTDF